MRNVQNCCMVHHFLISYNITFTHFYYVILLVAFFAKSPECSQALCGQEVLQPSVYTEPEYCDIDMNIVA